MDNTSRLRNHHLDKIGQLHHLRYLSMRNCINLWYLPNSIGNLSHLQTLDTKGTRILELPTTITKLRKLQHVRATADFEYTEKKDDLFKEHYRSLYLMHMFALMRFEDSGAETCSRGYLELQKSMWLGRAAILESLVTSFWKVQRSELDLNMHDLFNLHRSFLVRFHSNGMDGIKAPRGIGKVTSMQTLGIVDVSREKENILKELSVLTQLRKLCVTSVNEGNVKKFWSAIAGHNQLRSLAVSGRKLDHCLGGDLLPPKHLETLKLFGYLYRVPEWMHHLRNLSKLDLNSSRLNKDVEIRTLGDLPNLTVLRLGTWAIEMHHLYFIGSSFPSLVQLEVSGPSGVECLTFEQDATPKLELLQSDSYREMKGLQFLTNLKEIRMHSWSLNKMKIQLQNQYVEHPNLKNLSLKLI